VLLRRNVFYGALVCAVAFTAIDASSQLRNPALPQSLKLTLTPDGLPKDMPELSSAAMQVARKWRPDALNVSIEYEVVNAPNMKGPQVRVRAYSPSTKGGYQITVKSDGAQTFEFNGPVRWGTLSLPAVFVDLPVAARIAGQNGMKTPIGRAILQVYAPSGAPPVLAWRVGPNGGGNGRTVNGATGEIITFDVTGYIASYNQQWQKAARALRALLNPPRAASSGVGFDFGGVPGSSSAPYDDGSARRAEYERNAAEGRAYWSGDPGMYDRAKSGQCTWSDNSRVGC
jgi:hypothetical protein